MLVTSNRSRTYIAWSDDVAIWKCVMPMPWLYDFTISLIFSRNTERISACCCGFSDFTSSPNVTISCGSIDTGAPGALGP